MVGGVPSRRRKLAVCIYQAAVCPTLRGRWRGEILDLDALSQLKVPGAIPSSDWVEVIDASFDGHGIQ